MSETHLGDPVAMQQFDEPWRASPYRYEGAAAHYRRCGLSGLDLPAISLGLWQHFGADTPMHRQRDILCTAFDMGITQFDLANNYGVPYGSAESNFGMHLAHDFKAYRDELVITTKAGYDMWPGPYGQGGGGRKYVLASLDQSLKRMGIDYVDIFYSHRFDPTTPLEETMIALDQAVRSGRALYVGISSYDVEQTHQAVDIARDLRLPLIVHQPIYSMLNRWIENGVANACDELGLGLAVFSPLAQGLLTNKYLGQERIPAGSRMTQQRYLRPDVLTDKRIKHLRALAELADERGQSLAQMALAWLLRDARITTVLVGASSSEQIHDSVKALENTEFSAEELATIDEHSHAASLI